MAGCTGRELLSRNTRLPATTQNKRTGTQVPGAPRARSGHQAQHERWPHARGEQHPQLSPSSAGTNDSCGPEECVKGPFRNTQPDSALPRCAGPAQGV